MPRTLDRNPTDTAAPAPPALPLALRRTVPRHVLTVHELEQAAPPASARALVLLSAAVIGAFLAWAQNFPVPERARGSGEIVPAGLVQPVQAPEGGRIAALLVQPGELVSAGQVLVRLDAEPARADAAAARAREAALALAASRLSAAAEGRLAEASAATDATLAAIHDSQAAVAEATARLRAAELAVLDAGITAREVAAAGLEELVPPALAVRDMAREEASVMGAQLARGLARRNEVFALRQTELRSEGDAARVLADLAAARLAVAEARARREEFSARARNEALTELAAVERELAEARQGRLRAEARLTRLDVVAPVEGVLKQVVPRGTGSVVEPGGLVAEIVPADATVLADVEVPAERIGNVRAGQKVRVQVLTYDPARFGTLDGVVEQVSAASFRRPDGGAFYRVRVALAAAHLGDPARGLAVTPGMTVAADIVTSTQPLLQWLLKPMRNALDNAFAER